MKKIIILLILLFVLIGLGGLYYYLQRPSQNLTECGSEYIYQGIKHSKECDCEKTKETQDIFGGTTAYCDNACEDCQCYQAKFNSDTETYDEKVPVTCPLEF